MFYLLSNHNPLHNLSTFSTNYQQRKRGFISFSRKVEPISLLKTVDGGQTWQAIPYSIE